MFSFVLQLGLDVWKRLLAEPLKDTIVTLLLAELLRYLGDQRFWL